MQQNILLPVVSQWAQPLLFTYLWFFGGGGTVSVSLCTVWAGFRLITQPSRPQTHNLPVSASQVLRLQVCTIIPS
jgi:hypothetical protein